MRKQTKLVAVLSAAALLAIGASMTSFAATGWVNENGTFYYYDNDGEMVTNEWKKDGNGYFYLGDEGEMVTSDWVDSEYYVGPNGAMVKNAWVKTMPEDTDDTDPDSDGEAWFYFNNKGKKVTGKEMKINGRYYRFDEDGKMVDGWYRDGEDVYYYGDEDDGARKSGWLWLETAYDEGEVDEEIGEDYDTEAWYYFDSNGARVQGREKKINGKYYSFNQFGQMNYGWVLAGDWMADSVATYSDAEKKDPATLERLRYYFNQDNGARVTGFIKIDGPNGTNKQDDNNWYYFKDGKAKKASSSDSVMVDYKGEAQKLGERTLEKKVVKLKLEGKYFAFDEKGVMKTGKQAIKDGDDYAVYYFDENGYMKTGKVTGVGDGDDESTYYFNTSNTDKGQGVTGNKDGYLYYKGRRQDASDDYKIVTVDGKNYYLVNTKGKIQKSTSKVYEEIENEGIENVVVNKDGKVEKVNVKDKDDKGADLSIIKDAAPKAPYFD